MKPADQATFTTIQTFLRTLILTRRLTFLMMSWWWITSRAPHTSRKHLPLLLQSLRDSQSQGDLYVQAQSAATSHFRCPPTPIRPTLWLQATKRTPTVHRWTLRLIPSVFSVCPLMTVWTPSVGLRLLHQNILSNRMMIPSASENYPGWRPTPCSRLQAALPIDPSPSWQKWPSWEIAVGNVADPRTWPSPPSLPTDILSSNRTCSRSSWVTVHRLRPQRLGHPLLLTTASLALQSPDSPVKWVIFSNRRPSLSYPSLNRTH